MFSTKSLFTTISLLALAASSALAAPALSCPAPSTVTVIAGSSASTTASRVAIGTTTSVVSSSAAATSSASSKDRKHKDKDGKHKGGKGKDGSSSSSSAAVSASSSAVSSSALSSSIAASSVKGGSSSTASNIAIATSSAATKSGSASGATSTVSAIGTGGDKGITGTAVVSTSSSVATATDSSAVSATAAPPASTSGTGTSGDEQSATTLNSAVIATGFALDGQQVPAAGQVASLTSKNNFINFCLTVNKPITNGQQIKTGSCNPAPMGVIAATTNMPSSKFQFPSNFGTVKANTAFTIKMAINNIETGNFVNAQSNYYSAPQQVNGDGNIIGHSHVVIEQLDSLNQTSTTDPNKFAFFKGINGAAVDGVVTADVTAGLPAGAYRLASINAAANHQPVLVAVAQHGSLDDMVYFTVE